MIVGTQSYTWYQVYQEAQGKKLSEHWDEVLAIDYQPLVARLRELRFAGPLIMEQAVEKGTPTDLPPLERERQSRAWVRAMFGV
jgi:hypothetical protein